MPEPQDGIRLPWSRSSRRIAVRLVQPLQRFLSTEAAGGILLLAAAGAALVWANSPWSASYESLWERELTVRIGSYSIHHDMRHWINDALMTLFFFVVGLEIKREMTTGELRDPRAAALPVVAAVGGMAGPALLYAAFNAGGSGSSGWGIPMATDIAFAVGVLSVLGRGTAPSLKLFLLSLAIVDDIGAIAVIAMFYSGGISWPALGVAVGLLVAIAGCARAQVRAIAVYVVLGALAWLATFESGVHATIAGVALGLMTPSRAFQRPRDVSEIARRTADETEDDPSPPDADADAWLRLSTLSAEAISPLARLEHALHPWTSYAIIPLFALANAGVRIDGGSIAAAARSPVTLGVIVGLVVGKLAGIVLFSWASVRVGFARLPAGATWRGIVAAAALAGIGFTVSLFIAGLAFADPGLVDHAKIGILGASLVSGIVGAILLRSIRRAA